MGRPQLDNKADTIFSFRLSSEEKETLNRKLIGVGKELNNSIGTDDYKITRNEIIYNALVKGLQDLSIADVPKRIKKKNI